MKAHIISVINQKGGVGKTTTTYNLASILAEKGNKVLMIDNDPQASLTLVCGYNPKDLEVTIADIYGGSSKTVEDGIIATNVDNLHIIPSTIELASIELNLISKLSRESILKRKLAELGDKYNYIIIDNPPNFGTLSINALVSSDWVLIPCSTNPMSTYALPDIEETIEEVKAINPNLKELGIVATMYNKNTTLDNNELKWLEENHEIIGIIKRSVEASKGIEQGIPCIVFDKSTDVAKQYLEMVENILKKIEG